jgi:hypothetical protein
VGTPNGVLGFRPAQNEAGPASEGVPATGGGSERTAAPPTPVAAAAPPAPPAVRLSGLGLTAPALIALSRHRPLAGKIAFAFVLNVPARVRATLMRRVRSHGRVRFLATGRATTLTAHAGRSVGRLRGARRLAPGVYRLTVTPSGGASRSIQFRIR